MSIQDLTRTALMIALCVAAGYLLVSVPNVELISAAVFTCGMLAGVRRGALVGLLAEGLYSSLNPYGMAPPPLFAAQVLGFAILGGAGGALRGLLPRLPLGLQGVLAGLCGFTLTLLYDVLTNSAIWITVREGSSWVAVQMAGLTFPFPLAHPLTNALGFALLAPAVGRVLRRRTA